MQASRLGQPLFERREVGVGRAGRGVLEPEAGVGGRRWRRRRPRIVGVDGARRPGAARHGLVRRHLAQGLGQGQEGVFHDLARDLALQLLARKLEEADRLLQLGREDEPLGLLDVEAKREAHAFLSSAREAVAEVDPAHLGIGDDGGRRALGKHRALGQDVGAVDDVERVADVVVSDEHADAALF